MSTYVGVYSVNTWCVSIGADLQGSDAGGKRLPVAGEERLTSFAANLRRSRAMGRNGARSGNRAREK